MKIVVHLRLACDMFNFMLKIHSCYLARLSLNVPNVYVSIICDVYCISLLKT